MNSINDASIKKITESNRIKKKKPNPRSVKCRQQEKEGTTKPTPPSSRPQNATDGPANKNANCGQEDEDGDRPLSIKFLIPSSTVGAIIGKNGEAMNNLRKNHKCQIQITKEGDTYPGTTENICFMKGRLNGIMAVIESIQDKIRKKCGNKTGNDEYDFDTPRGNEMKIVVPNTSAKMIRAKDKTLIKLIRKRFTCQIEIYPKDVSVAVKRERVVTVAHEESATLLKAVRRVLRKVASDPHHSSDIKKEDFAQKTPKDPSSCIFSANECFNRLKEEYRRTGKVDCCPARDREHPIVADVKQWVIEYKKLLSKSPPKRDDPYDFTAAYNRAREAAEGRRFGAKEPTSGEDSEESQSPLSFSDFFGRLSPKSPGSAESPKSP
ncbi:hypothetical protein GCK72_012082 [Caenorhabditis remanei]|uniref:K Homology domain-containing protein n=1 Tax=Caenorhabditis remanei TaxID=31234 RepID=A0A6A5GMA1_CAERE|nr:hypothetical protein GCK72_012082 [Caenorhabditis remanei]KAF1755632.1 hypothetical protein GCK72_012082 [Caenorhabditis remanei]